MVGLFIYLAVIASGASVLAVEIVGTRVIAPFYGASLYLWSALISVTLAALSLGYAIGGRYADRGASLGRFCSIIGIAGVWIALIPWLRIPAFAMAGSMGLRTAVLFIAFVLFFPPLALLGMVSPYAIRLKAEKLEVVGTTAGNLYAVSTIASVAAAVATGFFLIPNIGVTRLIFLTGILLVATALAGLMMKRRLAGAAALLILAALVWKPGLGAASGPKADPGRGLVAVVESAYAEIRIADIDGLRYMFIDGITHSGADPETWDSSFEYVNVLDIPKYFFSGPGEMLLVGLGGGSIAKNYARKGWVVDAVEIDPAVTRAAREHFALEDGDAAVYEMDGRQFLLTHDKAWDVIVMDAFGSSSVPFHLVTEEAFGLTASRLKPDGILALNLHSIGWRDEIVISMAATLGRHFEHVTVLPIAEPPDRLDNIILLASQRELALNSELPPVDDRFSAAYDMNHAWDNRFEPDVTGARILTDDLNPVDVWSERINLASRKNLREYIEKKGIEW
jgi:spermidine synthase